MVIQVGVDVAGQFADIVVEQVLAAGIGRQDLLIRIGLGFRLRLFIGLGLDADVFFQVADQVVAIDGSCEIGTGDLDGPRRLLGLLDFVAQVIQFFADSVV